MKYSFFYIVLLLAACSNIDNSNSLIIPIETNSTEYNSILVSDYRRILDTITVSEFMNSDSLVNKGNHIITTSNKNYISTKITYLSKELYENRTPGFYGRNSKHITFYLFNDSIILFSNDFIKYDTIPLSICSKLIQQYYFEEKKHLRFKVDKDEKGIDIRIYKNISPNRDQMFVDTLSAAYINVIDNYCDSLFKKEFKKLQLNEKEQLKSNIKFFTVITVSSFNSPYRY